MNRQDAKAAKEPEGYVDRVAHDVIGAAIDVHRELGPGYLESVYDAALAFELTARGLYYRRQSPIPVPYKGHVIGEFRADFIVGEVVVVELKAVEKVLPVHHAQVLSYLKAGAYQVGLLLNFNVPLLRDGVRRFVWNG